MSTDGQPAQAVARIEILVLAGGNVVCKAEGRLSEGLIVSACEVAKFDLLKKLAKAQSGDSVVVPPPGLRVPRTGDG
jgi:hypothetical protein